MSPVEILKMTITIVPLFYLHEYDFVRSLFRKEERKREKTKGKRKRKRKKGSLSSELYIEQIQFELHT